MADTHNTQGREARGAGAAADKDASGDEQRQFLTFLLSSEPYAIGILSVKEIIEYGTVTPVPTVPEFIRGVINLRGSVVPVIDLAARFGRPSCAQTKRTCIIILEVDAGDTKQVLGVMVDSVNTVMEIAPSEIEPAPAFGARIRTDFIRGMGKVNGKFVIILNINHVLSIEEMSGLLTLSATQDDGAS